MATVARGGSINGTPFVIRDPLAEKLAAIERGTYEGTNLALEFASEIAGYSSAWAWIQARIQAGNFDGLMIGDYIEFVANSHTYRAQIAGINTYKGYGDSGHIVGNHIDFVADKLWDSAHVYNVTDTNNGTSSTPSPWMASNLRTWLNNTTNGPLSYLPSALRDVVVDKRMNVPTRYGGSAVDTNAAWIDMGKLWVPTEVEVFGFSTFAIGGYATMGSTVQYPLFRSIPARMKPRNGESTYTSWWLLNASSNYPTAEYNTKRFVCSYIDGRVHALNASDPNGTAPICFRIA